MEEQERDGEGDVAVRLLAQSSPVPVRFYFGYALVIITVPVEFLFRNRYTFYLRTSTYFIQEPVHFYLWIGEYFI